MYEYLIDVLERVRLDPIAYLGGRSLTRLVEFLSGYRYAQDRFITLSVQPPDHGTFGDWVAARVIGRPAGPRTEELLICLISDNDIDAYSSFFSFWDEYKLSLPVEGKYVDENPHYTCTPISEL